jgi:protein ImuB
MARILCLWLPNWPIQRVVQCRPELKNRAVALAADGPRGGQVTACSSEAVAQSVRPEMPVAEAQALARDLVIVPHEPSADRRALAALAEACERFSPSVAIEDDNEPESLLLDISNVEHLWDSEAALTHELEQFFTRRGYRVRVAVADTAGLAWGLAHCEGQRVEASTSKPTQDCKMQNANCKFSITEQREFDNNLQFAIQSLPIEALRVADDTAALLRQLGIETVGQLTALPRQDLTSRFGEELLRRLDQLTGAAREVTEPHRALAPLETSHALDEPTADRFVLSQVLRQLVERLARQLAARDQGAVLLMCFLRCTDGRTVPLRIGLLQPSANVRQLLELVDLHLETVALAAEVDRIELRVAVVGRLGQRQSELFADRWPSDPHQLALLVNRLSSRLGHEQVLRAKPRASPVPERAVRWVAAVEKSRVESRGSKARKLRISDFGLRIKNTHSAIHNPQSAIPLLLYPAPQTLEVVCVAPDGPPQFVWVGNRRERIVHFSGPERIETLWWRGPSVRRDYYRVALASGSHLWIFRRLSDRRWFLHGAFS